MSQSTKPVESALSYERYCASIGVDVGAARVATVVRALHAELMRGDAALKKAHDELAQQ